MEIDYFSFGFLVPAFLTILLLTIPVTIITGERLSLFKTLLAAVFIYSLIIMSGIQPV